MKRDETIVTGGVGRATVDIDALNRLAINGLAAMFDTGDQLFCFRLKAQGSQVSREGLSRRYTIMSLLGLWQAERKGLQSPVPIQNVLNGLINQTTWIDNLGDLGLLVWLCALVAPDRLAETCAGFAVNDALTRYPDARERRTMELAWFLTGLSHAIVALPAIRFELADVTVRTYQVLYANQGAHGIFGHLASSRTVGGRLRGSIGSFADQVYPIYALTRFAQACEAREALDRARRCADAICKVQGPLGQWWWHYNASTGKVAQRYPVYAVHQDAMAPMALFAVGEAAGLDYGEPIYKGLDWISGNNELNRDFRDTPAGLVWRSIYRPKGWKKHWDEVREFLGVGSEQAALRDLKMLFECRPYHLGWLLYAFAGRDCE